MRSSKIMVIAALFSAATWPTLDLLFANKELHPSIDLFDWAAGMGAFAALFVLCFTRPLGSFGRAASVIALPLMLFFIFAAVEPWLRLLLGAVGLARGAVTVFMLAWVGIVCLAIRVSRREDGRIWLLLLPVFFWGSSAVALLVRPASPAGPMLSKAGKQAIPVLAERPNVYHFLFDGLARPDILAAEYGTNLSPEVAPLTNAGLLMVPAVETRYLDTVASINGLLDPSRDTTGLRDLNPTSTEVVRTFRANGYHYAHYGEVFDFSACRGDEDECLSRRGTTIGETDVAMLRRTPIFPVWRKWLLAGTESRNLRGNLHRITDAAVTGPAFHFSYMVPPHPPFIFRANCSLDAHDAAEFTQWDIRSVERYRQSYACVMRSVATAVKQIAATDPNAVIIVSGDHGTMFRRVGNTWSVAALAERRPVFLAVKAPERCRRKLVDLRVLSELYPTLFACLENRHD